MGSYFGLIPSEESSGGKTAAGKDQQTGSSFLRFFAGGSGTDGGALDPQLKRFYRRLAARKNRSVAKVAVARKWPRGVPDVCAKDGRTRNYVRPSCR